MYRLAGLFAPFKILAPRNRIYLPVLVLSSLIEKDPEYVHDRLELLLGFKLRPYVKYDNSVTQNSAAITDVYFCFEQLCLPETSHNFLYRTIRRIGLRDKFNQYKPTYPRSFVHPTTFHDSKHFSTYTRNIRQCADERRK